MSTALVRQALEFVDQDETTDKIKTRKRTAKQGSFKQVQKSKVEHKRKVQKKEKKSQEDIAEENVKRLLALSKPAVDKDTAEQIVTRARKGKPLLDKIEVKKEVEKSILFPDD